MIANEKQPFSRRMRKLARFLILVSLLVPAVNGFAQQTPSGTGTAFTVISYNVQFLPGMASAVNKRKEPNYRAARIAEEMSSFDLVALQETFNKHHRKLIIEGLRERWGDALNVVESPYVEGRLTNGGCLLLTTLPVLKTNALIFEHYSTPEEYGVRADGHAAKGVIHARIARDKNHPKDFIDVFVTHLEARAGHLRPFQYVEMADFISKESDPGHPMLLLGDLNTRGMPEYWDDSESQYSLLMGALNGARPDGGVRDTWPVVMGKSLGCTSEQESTEIGKRIDYIIFGNPEGAAVRLKPVSVRVDGYLDERVVALSDHSAVVAEFEWGPGH